MNDFRRKVLGWSADVFSVLVYTLTSSHKQWTHDTSDGALTHSLIMSVLIATELY